MSVASIGPAARPALQSRLPGPRWRAPGLMLSRMYCHGYEGCSRICTIPFAQDTSNSSDVVSGALHVHGHAGIARSF